MKKLLVVPLFLLAVSASADHMDVIQINLDPKCSLEKYLAIVKDFNETWGKDHAYRAEIAVPLQNDDLTSIFWVGRSANAAAFGAAWDAWRDALPKSKSVAARLQARFDKCSDNGSRSSFDVY